MTDSPVVVVFPKDVVNPRLSVLRLPHEAMVKDLFTGHVVCAEYKHEKVRLKGKGDRFKLYHPLFGEGGFRWFRKMTVLGLAATETDMLRHIAAKFDPTRDYTMEEARDYPEGAR